jgi:hypothetical protein
MTAVSASFISASPLLALGLVVLGFVVYCEVDLARAHAVRHLPKSLWAIICVLSIPLGGILYLSLGTNRSITHRAGGAQ